MLDLTPNFKKSMKQIITLLLTLSFFNNLNSQTTIWSSNMEDFDSFINADIDVDQRYWRSIDVTENFAPVLNRGFSLGKIAFSLSYDNVDNLPITPDNVLVTPQQAILVPNEATNIAFKIRVSSYDEDKPSENFAIYVFDEADGYTNNVVFANKIYEETLTDGTASKIVTATIPDTFAGKNIGIALRHYNCTNQRMLIIDDLEVSYANGTLSTEDYAFIESSVYPNPFKNELKINSKEVISSVEIYNSLGQKIMTFRDKQIQDNKINVTNLPSHELFIVNLISAKGHRAFRLIKK